MFTSVVLTKLHAAGCVSSLSWQPMKRCLVVSWLSLVSHPPNFNPLHARTCLSFEGLLQQCTDSFVSFLIVFSLWYLFSWGRKCCVVELSFFFCNDCMYLLSVQSAKHLRVKGCDLLSIMKLWSVLCTVYLYNFLFTFPELESSTKLWSLSLACLSVQQFPAQNKGSMCPPLEGPLFWAAIKNALFFPNKGLQIAMLMLDLSDKVFESFAVPSETSSLALSTEISPMSHRTCLS